MNDLVAALIYTFLWFLDVLFFAFSFFLFLFRAGETLWFDAGFHANAFVQCVPAPARSPRTLARGYTGAFPRRPEEPQM